MRMKKFEEALTKSLPLAEWAVEEPRNDGGPDVDSVDRPVDTDSSRNEKSWSEDRMIEEWWSGSHRYTVPNKSSLGRRPTRE